MIGHKDAETMARCLVGYIACDRRIQREIRTEFDSPIGLDRIAQIRRERHHAECQHRRGKLGKDDDQRGWDWRGERNAETMERASSSFIRAIERERTLEAA